MSRKKLLKFLPNDEVTFKEPFISQMFGFYYIDEILVRKEKVKYTLYQINEFNIKVKVPGLYNEEDFIKLQTKEQPKSLHKLNKVLKKKKRLLKIKKSKKKDNKEEPFVKAMIVYRLNNKPRIYVSDKFKNRETMFEYMKQIISKDIVFYFYQMIECVD